MMYIKFILLQLLMGVAYLINLVVFPLLSYPLRGFIVKYPETFKWLILYWFSDASEDNYIDNWYGVYEIYNGDYIKFSTLNWLQKFFLSFKWGALRNPNWNLQILFKPKLGVKYDVDEIINEGEGGYWGWRNKTKHGKQFVKWDVLGTRYFRYSFTRKLKRKLFTFDYINVQLGASTNRYILKLRYFKLN